LAHRRHENRRSPRVGILPDFGNFYTDRNTGELYNPYKGLREFMPFVKQAVSAKAYDWDTGAGKLYTEDRREGREMTLDFERLIDIVVKAGYRGYIGIEYEGSGPQRNGRHRPHQTRPG
jgi:L-ribulose-5-phosphate 3-epimerase